MQVFFDRFAILLSGICAIHCILLPLAASLIPILAITVQHGQQLHQFWFHHFILIFIVPISLIALVIGFRTHKKWLPTGIALIGLVMLTFIALFAGNFIMLGIIPHQAEMVLTVIAGFIHAIGHVLNLIATRKISKHCAVRG